jgi:sec-independent protein translocase protein TatB
MFDLGFWELALIFVLALLVLGPERLPKVASQLGQWAGQARRMARVLTTQLRQELDVDPSRAFDDLVATKSPPRPSYNRPGLDELRPGSSSGSQTEPPPASEAGTTDTRPPS